LDRLACVDVEPLRLQLLSLSNPRWQGAPVAVLTKDGADGAVLELNDAARRGGVQLGMRYATALSLCPELRAAEVADEAVMQVTQKMVAVLRRFSPDIEVFERGTLLVRASGLELLTPSLGDWAARIRRSLMRHLGLGSAVGVGFSRLGALVAARVRRRAEVVVLDDPDADREAVMRAPLAAFAGLPPAAAERLRRLAIDNVSQLLKLPADAVLRRLGPEVHRLHRLATGAIHVPLEPVPEVERFRVAQDLEPPEKNAVRMLFRLKRLLGPLLLGARRRGRLVRELELMLESERGVKRCETVGAAEPCLDEATWVELLRLRLERVPLDAGVGKLAIELHTVQAAAGQLALLPSRARREVGKADEGLARVRAEFGADAVVAAELVDEHVPERRWRWRPFGAVPKEAAEVPAVRKRGPAALVRRAADVPLGSDHGAIEHLGDPSFVSWGWWLDPGDADTSVQREYRYARMDTGAVLWLRRDSAAPHGRWRVAAVVQ